MYLLDTHTLLWYFDGDVRLSQDARIAIDGDYPLFVSIASFWEIAIKKSIGKLTCSYLLSELDTYCRDARFSVIPITVDHLDLITILPFIHRDPFDRLLIAQAKTENFTIITCDEIIPAYPVETLW